MELVNELYAAESALANGDLPIALLGQIERTLALLLEPFAPYLAHELWELMGEKGSLLRHPWPKYEPALAKEEEIEIAIQVNGKLRSRVLVSADASEEDVRQLALADPKVKASVDGKQVVKAVVVPHKLVNIVVR
jgi:leucyl-tRNA synthetase